MKISPLLGVGIWFFSKQPDFTGANSLFLDENTGLWKQENIWTQRPLRSRACAVTIDNNRIAYIGGQHRGKYGPDNIAIPDDEKMKQFGKRISVYTHDDRTETPRFEDLTLASSRTHLSCTLIPNCNGNPTVAILGDDPNGDSGQDTKSMSLELWDTVTNMITEVGNPTGFDDAVLFRPMILTLGEDSILFTGGSINRGGVAEDHDGEVFQYTCGTPGTWTSRGNLNPALVSRQMYGTYTINENSPNQKNILNACAEEPPAK